MYDCRVCRWMEVQKDLVAENFKIHVWLTLSRPLREAAVAEHNSWEAAITAHRDAFHPEGASDLVIPEQVG